MAQTHMCRFGMESRIGKDEEPKGPAEEAHWVFDIQLVLVRRIEQAMLDRVGTLTRAFG